MLLQGRYDFTPRHEDSHQTLDFNKGDILLFIEIYPKDSRWFRVVDGKGRVGYVPKIYMEMREDVSRATVMEFLLEASMRARRDGLNNSINILEQIKEDAARIEFREYRTKVLRQAFKNQEAENQVEIEDGTTYSNSCDSESKYKESYEMSSEPTERTQPTQHLSIKTAPTPYLASKERNFKSTNNQKKPYPLALGRSSRSYSQYPNNTSATSPNQEVKRAFLHDDNGPSYRNAEDNKNPSMSTIKASSTTRIPIRTPIQQFFKQTPKASNIGILQKSHHEKENQALNWERMAARLIKIVQESSNLDIKKSETVVHRVLHHIKEYFNPEMPEKVVSVLRVLETSSSTARHSYNNNEDSSSITGRVNEISKFLKTQEFQGYHHNSSVIETKLNELHDELMEMDRKKLRDFIHADHFQNVHNLIIFYKSIGNESPKMNLLGIFSMIATIDPDGRSVMLRSTLPIAIAHEMYQNETNSIILCRMANTLTSLFSSGETMPETHVQEIGSRFINFILNLMEDSKYENSTRTCLMNLLLAYNLQFNPKDENTLIKVLAGRHPGRYFMDLLMNLVEGEVDPLTSGNLEEASSGPHSVFKLVKDIFSSRMTAEHFHKADMKWLTDLIYKNITELEAGDRKRTDYLELLWLALRNRNFQYRLKDLRDSLVNILLEEDPLAIPDQRAVKGISKEFPAMFKKGSSVLIENRSQSYSAF